MPECVNASTAIDAPFPGTVSSRQRRIPVGCPLLEPGCIIRHRFDTCRQGLAEKSVNSFPLATIVDSRRFAMNDADSRCSNVVPENPIANDMPIGRHQHPVVKKMKSTTTKEHAIRINKPVRICLLTDGHFASVKPAKHATAGNNISAMLFLKSHYSQDVISVIPVVSIQESHCFVA